MTTIERQRTEDRRVPGMLPPSQRPVTYIHDGFIYEVIQVNKRNVWLIRHELIPFEAELGYDYFRGPYELRHNVQPGKEVIIVKPVEGRDIGKPVAAVTQEMREGTLVIGAKVVKERYRNQGIGSYLAEDAVLRHKPKDITGRTRKGAVIRIYEKLEFEGARIVDEISPIDTGGQLSEHARQVFEAALHHSELRTLDLTTGLYPPGTYPKVVDIREFRPPRNNPEAQRIYSIMRGMGIDPYIGNGFRYDGKVNQEVLEAAAAAYKPREVVVLGTLARPRQRLIASLLGLPQVFIQGALTPAFKKY